MNTPPIHPATCAKCATPMTSPVNSARAELQLPLCYDCANADTTLRPRASIHLDHDGNPTIVLPGDRQTLTSI